MTTSIEAEGDRSYLQDVRDQATDRVFLAGLEGAPFTGDAAVAAGQLESALRSHVPLLPAQAGSPSEHQAVDHQLQEQRRDAAASLRAALSLPASGCDVLRPQRPIVVRSRRPPSASRLRGRVLPKIVDHEKRREEVVAATWRVIDRLGLEEATTRRIAEEAGYSSGVLAHYFKGKDDILVQALTLAHTHVRARAGAVTQSRTGLAALRAVVEEALPLDAERLLEARIEFSFLERARTVPRLREVHCDEQAHFRARLGDLVRGARADGAISSSVSDDEAVGQILVLVDGLSIQALLAPERVTADVQRRMLDLLVAAWGQHSAS